MGEGGKRKEKKEEEGKGEVIRVGRECCFMVLRGDGRPWVLVLTSWS